MLMKEDEGKQGFIAAKCSVFVPVFIPVLYLFCTCFIFASVPLFAASLNSLIILGSITRT